MGEFWDFEEKVANPEDSRSEKVVGGQSSQGRFGLVSFLLVFQKFAQVEKIVNNPLFA